MPEVALKTSIRAAAAAVALVAFASACEMSAEVTTTVGSGGRATFGMALEFDKRILDIVAQNPQGAAVVQDIAKIPAEFSNGGWTFRKTTPGGGLRLETRRRFPNVEALNRAVVELRGGVTQDSSPAAAILEVFKELEIERTSGFLKSQTRITGLVDVTPASLFGRTDIPPETQKQINDILSSQAGQFFKFRVRADLAGRITSATGDPEISGGSALWTPRFGRELRFSAFASNLNPFALLVLSVPLAAVLVLAAWRLYARRRPRSPVPGWEVGEAEPEPAAPRAEP